MYFIANEETEVQNMINLPKIRQWIMKPQWGAAGAKLKCAFIGSWQGVKIGDKITGKRIIHQSELQKEKCLKLEIVEKKQNVY